MLRSGLLMAREFRGCRCDRILLLLLGRLCLESGRSLQQEILMLQFDLMNNNYIGVYPYFSIEPQTQHTLIALPLAVRSVNY